MSDYIIRLQRDFLDRGGQNTIYLTFDPNYGKIILKVAMIDKNIKFRDHLLQEHKIFEELNDVQGLIKCYGLVKNDFETYLQLEYCQYGSLQSLQLFTIAFSEHLAFVVMRQLIDTVEQIHQRGYVHLDLKEGNILLTFNKEAQFHAVCGYLPIEFKISDLGISKKIIQIQNRELHIQSGTPRYMAPEQFESKTKEIKDPTKVDVFALGCILFHLVFKVHPFVPNSHEDRNSKESNFVEKFVDSNKNSYKIKISKELQNLLQGMLAYDPEKRWTLEQVKQSDWYQLISNELVQDKEKAILTKNQFFSKLQYIVNLTKIKIPVQKLRQEQDAQKQSQKQQQYMQQDSFPKSDQSFNFDSQKLSCQSQQNYNQYQLQAQSFAPQPNDYVPQDYQEQSILGAFQSKQETNLNWAPQPELIYQKNFYQQSIENSTYFGLMRKNAFNPIHVGFDNLAEYEMQID